MTCTFAQAAGVPEIVVTTPAGADGKINDALLFALDLAGATEIYKTGGAQAIAALAYGTQTILGTAKIFGPGNAYVVEAKRQVFGRVAIDLLPGPSEILVIADAGANAAWIAADMLAQAEHDVDASAILLTTSKRLAKQVVKEVERQLATLTTADVARKAIDKNSAVIVVRSLEEAIELSNDFAPEHLALHHEELIPAIRHAGSIFVGPFSPEAAGDYASGPNHVLPTSGVARLRGGLSAADYVKVISVQQLDAKALGKLAPAITTLARAEGLEAHARSVEVRLA